MLCPEINKQSIGPLENKFSGVMGAVSSSLGESNGHELRTKSGVLIYTVFALPKIGAQPETAIQN